ncbi:MAG: type III pantothenate kinase [Eggerthellaceae bacterium]|jgi:type III pantothenate kinase
MILAIDVGNTQTVIGVFDDARLVHMWRLGTNSAHTPDELRLKVVPLIEGEGIAPSQIEGAALSSVVPSLTEAWEAALARQFGQAPVVCSAETAGRLFDTTYPNPREIGADRIADAVAARTRYGAPVIVVDFGTATNMEVIDREGRFVGGIIMPGLETSARALFSRATKLAAVELVDPGHVIGRSTSEAMQAGIVYGEIDRVDGLVRRIFAELGYEPKVVATGGLAPRMAPLSSTVTAIDADLTLEGLRLVYEEHRCLQ